MTEQSNHSLNESLSALVDGEASPLEVRRLLKAGADDSADSELNARWSRYQLAGSVMRRELEVMAPSGFADRISEALADEAAPAAGHRHWWQRVGQVAVAASVAGAVLIGVQQYPGMEADNTIAGTSPAESGSAESDIGRSEPVSLPAGYQAPSLPMARTASAESGYDPVQRPSREVIFVPVRAESGQIPAEEIRAYLNQLMQAHSDHAARNSNQGVLPFARVTNQDEE
ncbi:MULTISPECIES: sigma-E factor negative regulatory protein [unclassified Marinimicrobium]|jgi:sigma-E factor negative regulatory protein RseA|uniref:sigma-E factor negative regulatory protein n=1 Tax=unclassified Marinimicrobium TaxID=2632100 RepID=UPI00257CC6F6|nr:MULTISPECIES: sigma-E factor negative regulatory protein [unclassified Marinimicrobium]|tara:strand:+ start:1531 stop:2217 length:687 start_codon:yes stop_codon:yes gene_type:complete